MNTTAESLQPGLWLNMAYGFGRREFYVISSTTETVTLACVVWCVSDTITMLLSELDARQPDLLGQGKLKWYWHFLPWRNVVAKYHRPHNR